jgi:hypothetical protein
LPRQSFHPEQVMEAVVSAYPVHPLTPLHIIIIIIIIIIQACSLLAGIRLLTGLSVPVLPGAAHCIALFLLLVSLSFSASYWLPDNTPSYSCLCLCPFHSTIHFILKMETARSSKLLISYTTLHSVTTQKTST